MGRRDLLFIVLVFLGLGAVASGLLQPSKPKPELVETSSPRVTEFQTAVARTDAAFERVWRDAKLLPAAEADALLVARRLSLALVGSAPSIEEIRQLEAAIGQRDNRSDVLDGWVESRLADRRSADYLAERFARAWVGVEDGPFILYRRRRFVSWLSDQLHANRPYDELVREVISAQGLWTDHPATNFVTVTIAESDKGPDEVRLAGRVSRAFLGVRLDCAQCHDHPFADWKREDFHHLAAFFGEAEQTLTGVRDRGGVYEAEHPTTGKHEPFEPAVPMVKELDVASSDATPRERLAAWVTHRDNRAFARATVNRVWAMLCGEPLVTPVDDLPLPAATSNNADEPAPIDVLAEDFAAHEFDLRRLIRVIAATRAFRASSEQPSTPNAADAKDVQPMRATFPVTRLRPEQVVGSLVQSTNLSTIGHDSHIVTRLLRASAQNDFIKQYGDAGEDELDDPGGTIPQRLILMNGKLVDEKTSDNLLFSAAAQIARLSPDDAKAIEMVYLAVLTRRPTDSEATHFAERFRESSDTGRIAAVQDLYWALLNSSEFAWNH